MADEKDIRLVNVIRAAFRSSPQDLDVPTFTPPEVAGFTLIARSGDLSELARQLKPWLPGYLRCNGIEESRAEPYLKHILDHLTEMGDRRFRDVLPEWLVSFAGPLAGAPRVPDVGIVNKGAVEIALKETSPTEAGWTKPLRAHLLRLDLPAPEDLLVAPPPDDLKDNKVLRIYLRELHGSALLHRQEGLRLFELPRAA
jgi:hypothetical protein